MGENLIKAYHQLSTIELTDEELDLISSVIENPKNCFDPWNYLNQFLSYRTPNSLERLWNEYLNSKGKDIKNIPIDHPLSQQVATPSSRSKLNLFKKKIMHQNNKRKKDSKEIEINNHLNLSLLSSPTEMIRPISPKNDKILKSNSPKSPFTLSLPISPPENKILPKSLFDSTSPPLINSLSFNTIDPFPSSSLIEANAIPFIKSFGQDISQPNPFESNKKRKFQTPKNKIFENNNNNVNHEKKQNDNFRSFKKNFQLFPTNKKKDPNK